MLRLGTPQRLGSFAIFTANRRGESIHVRLPTYHGRNLVDLRTWDPTEGGLKSGNVAEIRHLPRLAAALAKAEAKATELGLITDDDNDKGGAQ